MITLTFMISSLIVVFAIDTRHRWLRHVLRDGFSERDERDVETARVLTLARHAYREAAERRTLATGDSVVRADDLISGHGLFERG